MVVYIIVIGHARSHKHKKKRNFVFCAAGDAGEKGTFDIVLNSKHLIHAVKLRWPTQKLLQAPNFPSFSCGPWRGGGGAYGSRTEPVAKGNIFTM